MLYREPPKSFFIATTPGNRVRISAPTFQGRQRLDFRHEYYDSKTKVWRMTKSGVMFGVDQLDLVMEALRTLKQELGDVKPDSGIAEVPCGAGSRNDGGEG